MTKQTIEITQEELDKLREIAKQYGLIVGRGPFAKQGSIQKLAEEIARGNLVVSQSNKNGGR